MKNTTMKNPFEDEDNDTESTPLTTTDKEPALSPQGFNDDELWTVSIGYLLAMGVCGLVLVALGATLDDLSSNVGVKSTNLGTVFIARGCGAVFGAIVSSFLYAQFKGNSVLIFTLSGVVVLMLLLPICHSSVLLHIEFLFLGLEGE